MNNNTTTNKIRQPQEPFKYGAILDRAVVSLPIVMLEKVKENNLNLSAYLQKSLRKDFPHWEQEIIESRNKNK